VREYGRVDRVRLGQLAGRSSEVADLARVHDRDSEPGNSKRSGDRSLQSSGRFQNDELRLDGLE